VHEIDIFGSRQSRHRKESTETSARYAAPLGEASQAAEVIVSFHCREDVQVVPPAEACQELSDVGLVARLPATELVSIEQNLDRPIWLLPR